MAPTHRRGPWVPEEDQLLLQLVREQGPNNWVRISQHMHFRSPKQCRERFHQNLKPSLNREPISAEEGLMIERMVDEMGKRWAEIARRLGNRSDNAVKNWWNGSMNRKRRGFSSSHCSRTYSGRVEAPYPRASMVNRTRYPISYDAARTSWLKSPTIHIDTPLLSSNPKRDSPSGDCPRQLSPIYTLPAINRPIETPLTSPAFSDTSNGTFDPPSLVSDHTSVSSASPKTLPSPQLLPLPTDRRHSGEWRRQSMTSLNGSDDVYYHQGYQPGKTLESLSDYALKPRWSPPSWNQHSAALHGWMTPEETRPEETQRDARMGLNNLLN